MKIISIILLLCVLVSCGNKNNGPSYIELTKSECLEPYYSDEFKTLGGEISVFIDCKNDEIIYLDIWKGKIIKRVPLK